MNDPVITPVNNIETNTLVPPNGTIGASNLQHQYLEIRTADGKPGIRITREMAQGNFEISDEMILEIAKYNPMVRMAIVGLMNYMPDNVTVGEVRKTINVLLNSFVNGLHMHMAERISPGWVEKSKTE